MKQKKQQKEKKKEKEKGKERGNVRSLCYQTHATHACYAIMVWYWEWSVTWSWWLKEQEATSALSLIPNFEIERCREKWTEQREIVT